MKKILLKMAVVVMIVTSIVSCKKTDSPKSEGTNQSSDIEIPSLDENQAGTRTDSQTAARLLSLNILDDLGCSMLYDPDDMYSLGFFSGGYVFCVPSDYSNQYLVIFPQLSCAFVIKDLQTLSHTHVFTPRPPEYYDFEIYEACGYGEICGGKICVISDISAFIVNSVYGLDLSLEEYNLTSMFCDLAVGTYSYQGTIQSPNYMISLDEFLFSIAKECYYQFFDSDC